MVVNILRNATTTGAGSAVSMDDGSGGNSVKGFHAVITGTGALTATVVIEVSNDGVYWFSEASSSISLSGTGNANNGVALTCEWGFARANVTAISGTGATVNVTVAK